MGEGIRARLERLERKLDERTNQPTWILCLDENGNILDGGVAGLREWDGKHIDEWPPEWPVTVLVGVDPVEALGKG